MKEIFEELKEITLSRVSAKLSEISKRHGGELTKKDLEEIRYYIRLCEYIENL